MQPPPEETDVLVSVNDEHLKQLGAVTEGLRAAGMKVSQVMDDLGIVTGSIDSAEMQRLSAVEGVASVERAREVGIPPPDSPVQ